MYHHLRHAIGRHGGFGGGFGRKFGRGFQDGHGDNFPSGRKLSADELQLVILALLAESPAHGYEIIRRLEEHSSGFYKPSPGMVYPALTYLEEIGQTAVTQEGTRKLYTLTKEGEIRLQTDREQVDVLLEILGRIGKRMADAREAFAGLHDADPQAADSLHKARHALKSVLYRCRGCTSSEARRIADILNRAAAEILEKPEQ